MATCNKNKYVIPELHSVLFVYTTKEWINKKLNDYDRE